MANPDGPWVRFYASDWLAGTRGMTAAETGVYITLIATMYERAEPVVRDDARLARLCGLPTRNFSQILDRLIADDKISVDDTAKLWGRKVDMEVRNRRARAEKSSNAARTKHQQNQRPISASAPAKQAPSTSQKLPRARGSEPEPDKEKDAIASQKNARGSRLPTDWSIPNDWGRWAVEQFGASSNAVRAEAEKFRDYWIAKTGAQATKLDWEATWRNWCRTAFAPKAVIGRSPRQPTSADIGRQLIEEMQNAAAESSSADGANHPAIGQLSASPAG